MRLIKDYLDGTQLFFQQGKIDSWMVIFKGKPPLGLSSIPKDAQLLTTIARINSPSIWQEAINLSQQSVCFVDLPCHIRYIYNYSLETSCAGLKAEMCDAHPETLFWAVYPTQQFA